MTSTTERQFTADLRAFAAKVRKKELLYNEAAMATALVRHADKIDAEDKALVEALEPFAAFLDALEVMGGNTPKTGAFYTITSSVGEREITVEDFKRARTVLSRALGRE